MTSCFNDADFYKANTCMFRIFLIMVPLLIGLAGCATQAPGGTGSLADLKQLNRNTSMTQRGKKINQLRMSAIIDTALSLGARSGLAWRARQIDHMLKAQETDLDKTFNFYGLMLDHDVLPPVLVEAQNTLNLASPDTIRLATRAFKIKHQARFVTAPPTWRDYIWMNFTKPDVPDPSLLPKNKYEQKVWDNCIEKGWKNGIAQANNIFTANLQRLRSDYTGMILYSKLYSQHMVSAPFVSKTDLGVTGDGTSISIGDQVLRITALPQLQLHSKNWQPAFHQ